MCIRDSPHTVAVKDVVGVAGDKHQLKSHIQRPEAAGGLHAVQLPHLHVQKHQVQLPGMALQPAEQPLAGGKLEKPSLHMPALQNPLQSGPEHQPGVIDVVTDANAQHPITSSRELPAGMSQTGGLSRKREKTAGRFAAIMPQVQSTVVAYAF